MISKSIIPQNPGNKKWFKCEMCDKSFNHSTNLSIHRRIHTGEKPFKCDECSRAFNQSQHLKRHCLIHTGKKPFKCEICEKAFNDPSNLTRHRRIHNDQSSEIFSKAFNRSISVHRRVHTIERSFKCDICEKTFDDSSSLLKHRQIHTAEFKMAENHSNVRFEIFAIPIILITLITLITVLSIRFFI